MSITPPPTNTTTPVYNPIFYVNPTASSGIDVAFLDANYLKFPTAQGSEDFTNGLFSTDTIDFNSATGANRAITNVSKTEFSDILGNALYTAFIEENSNAIGIYDGGLIINSSNSINLVATDILANGVPIGTGGGNVSNNQDNTFQNGFTQTFDGVISIDNLQSNIGQFGSNNTGLGGGGGLSNITTGSDNTTFGYGSLSSLTTGISNTALGYGSLTLSTNDNYNTAIGNGSGINLNGGNSNTFLGYQSGVNQTTGNYNISIGYLSNGTGVPSSLSNTITIGNDIAPSATGDINLGFGDYSGVGIDYYAKFTPNTTFGGVQLQGTYNNSGNFTISAINQSVALEATFIDLNGSGSGAISGVNVSNGININSGVVQTTDKASNPTFQSLYSCFYSLGGLPYFAYNNAGTYTYSPLATATAPTTFSYTSGNGVTTISPVGTIWTLSIPIQTAIAPYQSPPWGKTFRWSAYTNYNQGSYDVNNAQVEIQLQFQLITGTGVYQPTFYSGSPTFYSYVFSSSINSLSGSSGANIGFLGNETINGVNTIQFFSTSNAGNLATFPMTLVIETIQ